jgi:hypothetical protein
VCESATQSASTTCFGAAISRTPNRPGRNRSSSWIASEVDRLLGALFAMRDAMGGGLEYLGHWLS